MIAECEYIKSHNKDGVGWIILDRPPLNIITMDMCRAMDHRIRHMDADAETKVIAVTSAGDRAFAAGADMQEHSLEAIEELLQVMGELLRLLQAHGGKPRIAVVKGICSGGGNELAGFCDLVVARADARFSQPEIFIGAAGNMGCMMMSRVISRRKALELALTGDWIDAAEAHRLGMVNQVFPVEGFEQSVATYLEKFTSKSMAALQLGRSQLYRTFDTPFDSAMDILDETFVQEIFRTEDYREGVAAFLEKRRPQWKNR